MWEIIKSPSCMRTCRHGGEDKVCIYNPCAYYRNDLSGRGTTKQNQRTVAAYLKSKQQLLFDFSENNTRLIQSDTTAMYHA